MKEKLKKLKDQFTLSIKRFSQFLYITFSKYADNYLWESASACSFGFIFSFIPIVLIIFTVMISVLKFNPNVLNIIMEFCDRVKTYYDFRPLVDKLVDIKSITLIHVFLGIWVIWMARKLFMSIIQGLKQIFRFQSTRKTFFYQLFSFLTEFVVVFGFILVILITFLFDKFIQIPIFDPLRAILPAIFNKSATNANRLITFVTYFLFFIFTFYCYHFVSGTKPPIRICLFYSLMSTLAFFVVSFFLGKFMNVENYNIIYGAIGTLLILLFKVYMFFIIFFFCAEMVYVSQYFDQLLVAQIYVLPSLNLNNFWKKYSDILFENPQLVELKAHTIPVESETVIYEEGESPSKVFYICSGIVKESRKDIVITHTKGDFFGDLPPILHKNYKSSAVATTKCEIMVIDVKDFLEIIKQDYSASTTAVNKLNKYTGENNIL